ncbi:MAG: histidine--tRNA ligase [Nitrospirae bacterium]|nr:histidine--tRNA ligase [Nitrospirota bacterium]
MHDIMPPDIYLWQRTEGIAREIFSSYGFQEIRPPVVESTGIFTRSIGENTDIVEKEMYTFSDKAGRSISLRPEGTASVVRCYVENNLHTLPAPQKFSYAGPMFRYERPQSGRFRQFYQIGVEAFGSPHPETDAELLSMLRHFLGRLGLRSLHFQVNSIGCPACRPAYREALLGFFSDRIETLCPDCRRRYGQNPLRILDCKVERCVEMRKGAPAVTDYLCQDCRSHFERLCSLLELLGISHTVNPEMVRGLDYYTRTTFEVTSENLGAQNTVAAGGRYDRLVKEFGGPDTPAIGFAIGMERLIDLIKLSAEHRPPAPEVFIATIGEQAVTEGMLLAEKLRISGLWVETGDPVSSLKSQMRRADRLAAGYVLVLGEDEIRSGKIQWKRFADSTQGEIGLSGVCDFILNKA